MRGWPCVSTQKEEATKPQTSTDAKATRRTADAPPFGTLRNQAAAPATYLSMATWCSSTETLPQSQCVILSCSTTTLPGIPPGVYFVRQHGRTGLEIQAPAATR